MKMILHWNKIYIYIQKHFRYTVFFLLTFAEQDLSPFGQIETIHVIDPLVQPEFIFLNFFS